MNIVQKYILVFCATLLPALSHAEQLEKFGDVVVRYSALSTDQLPAEVVKQYGMERSSRRGLLNIAVQRETGAPAPTPLAAAIKASATTLTGQRLDVTIREIKEPDAIYYLGEFAIPGSDTLRFDLLVTPAGTTQPLRVKFSKDYVVD